MDKIQELINLINLKFKYVEPQHLRELFTDMVNDIRASIKSAKEPDFVDFTLGTQPYVVNYHNKKHIFLWAISNFTAQIGELGTFNFVGGNWYNISFRTGIPITSTTGTANVFIKCTDEVVP